MSAKFALQSYGPRNIGNMITRKSRAAQSCCHFSRHCNITITVILPKELHVHGSCIDSVINEKYHALTFLPYSTIRHVKLWREEWHHFSYTTKYITENHVNFCISEHGIYINLYI